MEEVEKVRKKLWKRVLWNIVWTLFVRPFPRNVASRWEVCLLRLFGAKIGRNCTIYSSAIIWLPENLLIGDRVVIADHVIIQNSKPLYIKDGAMISQYTYICDGNHFIEDMRKAFAESITLEEDCWIGADCFIASGTTVGRGCMVGAKTVVRTAIPPYSILFGNPSKVVGFRFAPEQIIEYEKTAYHPDNRLSIGILEKNYKKYFLDRISDIKSFTKI